MCPLGWLVISPLRLFVSSLGGSEVGHQHCAGPFLGRSIDWCVSFVSCLVSCVDQSWFPVCVSDDSSCALVVCPGLYVLLCLLLSYVLYRVGLV